MTSNIEDIAKMHRFSKFMLSTDAFIMLSFH